MFRLYHRQVILHSVKVNILRNWFHLFHSSLKDESEAVVETAAALDDAKPRSSRRSGGSSGVQTKDAILDAMATSILGRLPPRFDVIALRKRHMVGEISPTLVVLIQELDRFNLILHEMRTSLRELRRAIAGEVGMSTELDDVAACLGRGSIPALWRRLVPDTEKSLAEWLQQLLQRNEQYKSWVRKFSLNLDSEGDKDIC